MDGFSIENEAAVGDSIGYSSNDSSKGRRSILNKYSSLLQFKTRSPIHQKENIKLALYGIRAATHALFLLDLHTTDS
jgi:hypothetical protein